MIFNDELSKRAYQHVYVGDEYRIGKCADIDVFIDAGANVGCASLKCIDTQKNISRVYAYETYKEYVDLYHKNIIENNQQQEVVINNVFVKGEKYGDVNSIEDVISLNKDKNIFLKIDIEGWEYCLLDSLNSKGLINVPKYIAGEFHNFHQHGFDVKDNQDVFDFFNGLDRKFIFGYYEQKEKYVLGNFFSVF